MEQGSVLGLLGYVLFICRLKREYESTDEKTNLGFIVSPMCDKQQEAISVKIVVHSAYSTEPVSFTSDGKSEL